jgi:hypothetical protein
MRFNSFLIDRKIMGVNVGVELPIGAYLEFAPEILTRNEYQRRKVSSHGKTYDLLRRDLAHGCIIPPIILAVTDAYGSDLAKVIESAVADNDTSRYQHQIEQFVRRAVEERQLLILDGLQRTSTLVDIVASPTLLDSDPSLFFNHPLRLEIYVGLSKPGILYRMLTLNTGQTPMSFRHQLEILYHDYLDRTDLPNGIEVLREAEDRRARGVGKYKYQDVVDMFYAFSTGSPMPYDRLALVGQLREINFLETYEYHPGRDDMLSLVVQHNNFVSHLMNISGNWHLTPDEYGTMLEGVARPFGTSVPSIFERPQPMAGFGAECKRLVDNRKIATIEEVSALVSRLHFSENPSESFENLIRILDDIARKAKKIGDSQRLFFQYGFRALLLEESESFLDLSKCWLSAQETFEMMH